MTNSDPSAPATSATSVESAASAETEALRGDLAASLARERALRDVLATAAEMYRRPAPADLMRMILHGAATLAGAADGVLAAAALGGVDGEGARDAGDEVLDVRVATGRFAGTFDLDGLPAGAAAAARAAFRDGRVAAGGEYVCVPLRANDRPAAVVVLAGAGHVDGEVLARFAELAGGALGLVLAGSGASVDAVTGTYVRAAAVQRLQQVLKGVHRRGEPCAVLRVRIGGFAALVQAHGPAAGDRALMAAGDMLRYWLRDTDVVGRWGADEFLVVLPDTGAEGERIVARRLHEQGGWLGFQHGDDHVELSLAIGAATLPGATEHETGILDAAAFEGVARALSDAAGASLDGAAAHAGPGDARPCTWETARRAGRDG